MYKNPIESFSFRIFSVKPSTLKDVKLVLNCEFIVIEII